ncbi:MAG: acyltransferase [Planctomycetota bacterium]
MDAALSPETKPIRTPAFRSNPGLDALRAFAALGVVALHAGVPYLRHPMPGLVWPVQDRASSLVDAACWAIEVMIMPLFLIIAGFLLWHSAGKLSPASLVKQRAKRLLVPLLFGVLVILPLDLYLWTIGLIGEGVVPLIKLKSLKFDEPLASQIWGLSHLWFLLYVFLYVSVFAAMSVVGIRMDAVLRSPKRRWLASFLIFVVAVVTLTLRPEIVWGFQHAFLPVPSKWIYSGAFFTLGLILALADPALTRLKQVGGGTLFLGVSLMIGAVMLGQMHLDSRQNPGGIGHWAGEGALALCTTSAAAFVSLGLIGCSQRLSRLPSAITYLAAASFWIYLVHHPLLGLIHMDFKWAWASGSPTWKWLLSFTFSATLCVLSYSAFIRGTRFGSLIGVSSPPKTKSPSETQPSEPTSNVATNPPRKAA